MIPAYPKFKSLGIEDRLWVARHLKQFPRHVCELTIGNLFLWQEFDHPQATCINKNLCILIDSPVELPYFLEPLGRDKVIETAEICLKHCGRVSRVSEDFARLLPKEKFELIEQRNQFDYIYLREELAALKGKKFDGKRNHIKRFRSSHPDYEFRPLRPEDKNEALELFEKWFEIREESKYFPRLAYTSQRGAIVKAFDHYKGLHLFGCQLRIGGKMRGFTLGSQLNPQTVSVHFMYGDPSFPGISQLLLWEASCKCYSDYKYLDLEQDLGIPGLRSAKLSWQPLKLEKKYEVKLKA